jgi:predicted negative regulator of RcsB-dependent stress response
MSRLMRQELEQQKQGNVLSRWLNRPWVLLPLFVFCVGLIVWRLWPESRPSAEWLFQQGTELMASQDPADWNKAWSEFLAPLNRTYPEHAYHGEVDAYAQKIEDHAVQQRALTGVKENGTISPAQRFYQRGLRLCQEGDGDAARQIWENVVRTFGEVVSEQRWVRLSEEALRALNTRTSPSKQTDDAVQEALKQARNFRDQGKLQKAEAIWKGLEALYRDDPAGQDVIRHVERDRKQ